MLKEGSPSGFDTFRNGSNKSSKKGVRQDFRSLDDEEKSKEEQLTFFALRLAAVFKCIA